MISIRDLREQLSDEMIKDILAQYDVSPVTETEDYIIFPTCCHNLKGGSPKLFYYKNTRLFYCFTECNETFDIFTLLRKMHKLRGEVITLKQAIQLCSLNAQDVKEKTFVDYNNLEDIKYLQSLNNITMEQWNSMSQTDRMREFGDLVGSQNSYTEATVFMNDRIAALEDYGKAERINIGLASNDAEAIKVVGELRDSITEAHNAGVQGITQVPADASFNNTTLKGVKDQSNETYTKLAEENATALKRSKHANNKK